MLAGELCGKGVDGFFIDNCDVYNQYQTTEIYDALVNIIERLNEYDIDVIINGGNDFVSQLILDGKSGLIDGVNQEGFPKVMQSEESPFLYFNYEVICNSSLCLRTTFLRISTSSIVACILSTPALYRLYVSR